MISLKEKPPIIPEIKDKFDIENFGSSIIKERPKIQKMKKIERAIIKIHRDKFKDF